MKSTLLFLFGFFVAISFKHFIDVSFWVEVVGVVGLIIALLLIVQFKNKKNSKNRIEVTK